MGNDKFIYQSTYPPVERKPEMTTTQLAIIISEWTHMVALLQMNLQREQVQECKILWYHSVYIILDSLVNDVVSRLLLLPYSSLERALSHGNSLLINDWHFGAFNVVSNARTREQVKLLWFCIAAAAVGSDLSHSGTLCPINCIAWLE